MYMQAIAGAGRGGGHSQTGTGTGGYSHREGGKGNHQSVICACTKLSQLLQFGHYVFAGITSCRSKEANSAVQFHK